MALSTGGVSTTSRLSLYPMQSVAGGAIGFYAFDPSSGFNDPSAGGFYSFKVEEVLPGRTPTFAQAIVKYRDLGPALLGLLLTGTTDAQAVISTPVIPVQIGNANATGRLMTKIVGLNSFTAQDVQLTLVRTPNAGPISIAKIVLCGRVEVAQELG